jgi:hypothetical protein
MARREPILFGRMTEWGALLLVVTSLGLFGPGLGSRAAAQDVEIDVESDDAGAAAQLEDPLEIPQTLEEELQDILSWHAYVYESLGRRDPFDALVSVSEDDGPLSDLPDPRSLILTGILWGEKDRFALVQDATDRSFVLREGDPVWRGHVVQVQQNSAVIRYNHFGMWKTITLPLKARKEAFRASER